MAHPEKREAVLIVNEITPKHFPLSESMRIFTPTKEFEKTEAMRKE